MKPFLFLIIGFVAAYLLKESTGLVGLYAPAIIFPLILPYPSRWQRVVYFLVSITCYTLMITSLAILKLNFPVPALLFFVSGAVMYLAYALLLGFEDYKEGLKAVLIFTVWYTGLVFVCGLILKRDFMEGHIAYIIVPAWYWVVGRGVTKPHEVW